MNARVERGLVKEYGREDIGVGESVEFIAGAAGVGAGIGFVVDAMIRVDLLEGADFDQGEYDGLTNDGRQRSSVAESRVMNTVETCARHRHCSKPRFSTTGA